MGQLDQAAGLLRAALGLSDTPAHLNSPVALPPFLDNAVVNEALIGDFLFENVRK